MQAHLVRASGAVGKRTVSKPYLPDLHLRELFFHPVPDRVGVGGLVA